MVMDGRSGASGEYRYGFQGQEMDDEVKGKGNSVNYKYRMHDPRVGRFFAVDPLAPKYPHNSPYAFSENRLLDGVELEGLEFQEAGKEFNFVGGVYDFETGDLNTSYGCHSSAEGETYSYTSETNTLFNDEGDIVGVKMKGYMHNSSGGLVATFSQTADSEGKLVYYSYDASVSYNVSEEMSFKNIGLIGNFNATSNWASSLSLQLSYQAWNSEMYKDYSSDPYNMTTGALGESHPELFLLGGGLGGAVKVSMFSVSLGAGYNYMSQRLANGGHKNIDWSGVVAGGVAGLFKNPFYGATFAGLLDASFDYTNGVFLHPGTKDFGKMGVDFVFGTVSGYGAASFGTGRINGIVGGGLAFPSAVLNNATNNYLGY